MIYNICSLQSCGERRKRRVHKVLQHPEHTIAQLEIAIVEAKARGLVLGLKSMKEEDIFPYFFELAKTTRASDLVSVAKAALQICDADEEIREQLKPMALIEATIAAAPEEAAKPSRHRVDDYIRELITMSAMLFNKCCVERKWYGDTTLAVAQRGLRLYDWMVIRHPPEKELAERLLENCGAILDQENLKAVKANLKKLVKDEEKLSKAYEALSGGYLRRNSLCHLASETLWRDGVLSQVSSTVPNYEILEILKLALTAVDRSKPETLKTAKLVYDQYTKYFGSQKAMEVVIFVRPDLAGEF